MNDVERLKRELAISEQETEVAATCMNQALQQAEEAEADLLRIRAAVKAEMSCRVEQHWRNLGHALTNLAQDEHRREKAAVALEDCNAAVHAARLRVKECRDKLNASIATMLGEGRHV